MCFISGGTVNSLLLCGEALCLPGMKSSFRSQNISWCEHMNDAEVIYSASQCSLLFFIQWCESSYSHKPSMANVIQDAFCKCGEPSLFSLRFLSFSVCVEYCPSLHVSSRLLGSAMSCSVIYVLYPSWGSP